MAGYIVFAAALAGFWATAKTTKWALLRLLEDGPGVWGGEHR